MGGWLTWIVWTITLMACGPVLANSDIALVRLSPQYVPLGPGQTGKMDILITNHGPDAALSVPIAVDTSPYLYPPSIYALQLTGPSGCGTLLPGGRLGYSGFRFYAGPIASGETLRCAMDVTRSLAAIDSASVVFQVFNFSGDANANNNFVQFFLGTFADVALSSQQINFSLDHDGIAHSVLRLTARNSGPADVGSLRVMACTDNFFPDFYIESDFPGGCGPDTGAICFDSGFGFRFPALASGQSASCNLRLTSIEPYASELDFPFVRIEQPLPDPATGGTLIDTNEEDDWVDLFQVAPPPQPAPAYSTAAQLLLALGIIALGTMALRRTRSR